MFDKKVVIDFSVKKEVPLFVYTTTHTYFESTNVKDKKMLDISFFTIDEWKKLQQFDEEFRKRQSDIEHESDDYYIFSKRKENPECNKVIEYEKQAYFMDRKLQEWIDEKFRNIDAEEAYETELENIYMNIEKYGKKNFTKDKLRNWFVEHYEILKTYYQNDELKIK